MSERMRIPRLPKMSVSGDAFYVQGRSRDGAHICHVQVRYFWLLAHPMSGYYLEDS